MSIRYKALSDGLFFVSKMLLYLFADFGVYKGKLLDDFSLAIKQYLVDYDINTVRNFSEKLKKLPQYQDMFMTFDSNIIYEMNFYLSDLAMNFLHEKPKDNVLQPLPFSLLNNEDYNFAYYFSFESIFSLLSEEKNDLLLVIVMLWLMDNIARRFEVSLSEFNKEFKDLLEFLGVYL